MICGPLLGNSDSLYLQVTTTSSWFTHVFSALFRKNTAPPNQPKSNSLVLVLDKDKPRLWIGCFVFLHGKPTKRFKIPMFSTESKSKIHFFLFVVDTTDQELLHKTYALSSHWSSSGLPLQNDSFLGRMVGFLVASLATCVVLAMFKGSHDVSFIQKSPRKAPDFGRMSTIDKKNDFREFQDDQLQTAGKFCQNSWKKCHAFLKNAKRKIIRISTGRKFSSWNVFKWDEDDCMKIKIGLQFLGSQKMIAVNKLGWLP